MQKFLRQSHLENFEGSKTNRRERKKKEKETESTKTFFCTSNAQFKSTQLFPFHTYKQTEP